ncbi:MAG: glycosyltransferase family 4 protein [Candidatus Moraniibacteriota bacterium]
MKIAFIGQKGIPAISGGVEKHVEKLAVELVKQGHEVSCYVRSHYTPVALTNYQGVKLIHIKSIHTKHFDAITHTLFSAVHALFADYDVIHFQSIGPSTLAFITRIFKRSARTVATFHSRDYFHAKWGFFARLFLRIAERLILFIPERTFVVSETLARYVKDTYGKECLVTQNGADVFSTCDASSLESFGLRPKQYVVSVSRLLAHKGIHYLIKAFMDLEDTNRLPNNFKLAIVGTHAGTAEYEDYLKVMASGRDSIIFLGERSGHELAALFSQAAVFVQPSEDEGLSLALLEAMGYGLPCVVSSIPANMEAIGDAGLAFENKSVESLKMELSKLINTKELMIDLGNRAEHRIATQYSWSAIAEKTVDAYQKEITHYALKRYVVIRS